MALMKLGQADLDTLELDTEGADGWWCLLLPNANELATVGGRLLVHRDKAELLYLITGGTAMQVPPSWKAGPFLALSAHPNMAAVQWPLNREEFQT